MADGMNTLMKHSYKANASVIFTDAEGNRIDTFVIFDTDPLSGLTHINYQDLKVPANSLELHAKTVGDYHLPLDDAFSFEMLKKLREKYQVIDALKKENPTKVAVMELLAQAS